jgi:hypothetical protein
MSLEKINQIVALVGLDLSIYSVYDLEKKREK